LYSCKLLLANIYCTGSVSAAAYRVIEDVENYNRIGGLKNEISRLPIPF
jgi:hypothetical protein